MVRKNFSLTIIILIVILIYPHYIFAQGIKEQAAAYSKKEREEKKVLKVIIAPIISPQETFFFYRKLFDYIGDKLGYKIKFSLTSSYAELEALLEDEECDLAFVCTGSYVSSHDRFGLELLVAPQEKGGVMHCSYIIVRKDSPIKDFKELKGKVFAFYDPLSISGKLMVTYLLAQIQETLGFYFKDYFYTYSHDASVRAVTQGSADGAAVDSLIWEHLNRIHPEITAKTKIIWKSPLFGTRPIVVRPRIGPVLKENLKQLFLNMHKDEKGREILQEMMIDKFVLVDDNLYNYVREIKSFIKRTNAIKTETAQEK